MKTKQRLIALVFALSIPVELAEGQITSVDLSQYQITQTINLPSQIPPESSAVTYNWNSGNLFLVDDEGLAVVEITTAGALVSSMSLSGFEDPEGITYIGGGKFLIAEERIQDVFTLTYVAGGAAARASLQMFDIGPTVGNVGLEGFAFDPVGNKFFGVKEKTPQLVYEAELDFSASTASVTNPFSPDGLGLLDLTDIQPLSTVPSLLGTADQNNLLILSQESFKLFEVDRTDGEILSSFDLAGVSGSIEGVTIGPDGTIYLVDEARHLFILSPIPEPSTYLFLALGGTLLCASRWARRRSMKTKLSPN